jgi:hypothetical protein
LIALIALIVLLACAGAPAAAARAGDPDLAAGLAELAWLAGCWEGTHDERRFEEVWLAPDAGTMIGMGRTVADGRTIAHEFLQIRSEGDRLVDIALPSGQAEMIFTAVAISADRIVFENPDHDFPQRIAYQHESDGSLLAWIEGERDGQRRRIEFSMQRRPCPGE